MVADPWSLSRPLGNIESTRAPALPPGRANRRWMRAAESTETLDCEKCREWQLKFKEVDSEIEKGKEVLGITFDTYELDCKQARAIGRPCSAVLGKQLRKADEHYDKVCARRTWLVADYVKDSLCSCKCVLTSTDERIAGEVVVQTRFPRQPPQA